MYRHKNRSLVVAAVITLTCGGPDPAELQGLVAATLFWPGSEAEISGVRPTYWERYNEDLKWKDRVADGIPSDFESAPGTEPS